MGINVKGDTKSYQSALSVGVVKKDLGATFANAVTEFGNLGIEGPFKMAIMENTNATGAGVRMYFGANGAVKYVALT